MRHILLTAAALSLLMLLGGCDKKEQTLQEKAATQKNVIIDDAYVLLDKPKLIKMYREYNEGLLQDYDIDFRVITTSNEEDIDIFANKEFARLQEESRSKSGKALLLVINTLQDKVRLEVSQALEPIFTDAFVSYIERKGFVPYFREYKIADGVYMATELVHDRATEAAAGKEFVPPMASKSTGGGSKTKANIGIADPDAKRGEAVAAHVSDTPMDVLERYLVVLKAHNKNPNLDIYTDTTKAFFSKWTVTDINQDHEVHNIAPCKSRYETLYDIDNTHAVLAVRPYDKHRTCSPYFFKKEDGKWKLDIATMAQTLRFNSKMQFHFDMQKRLKNEGMYYAFAFDGYAFDSNGYPHTPPKEKKPSDARWGYRCGTWYHPKDRENVKREPRKYYRCGILKVWRGSPAEVRLGLWPGDYIYSVGEGAERIDNVTYVQFMEYMKQIAPGQKAVVTVRVNHKEKIVREGIAP